jgi:hypothetical protein
MRTALLIAVLAWAAVLAVKVTPHAAAPTQAAAAHRDIRFATAETCMACHNGLSTASGEDISIGTEWRGSIMANSARDPYWQAAVRRETLDHPEAAADIEDECAVCHMPMSRARERAAGQKGRIFAHLPAGSSDDPEDRLAHDGVSCTICHQISPQGLGTPASFTGGFVLDVTRPGATPPLFGPFKIDDGRTRVMQSSSGFQPAESAHMRQSELCATCHTLITKALGPDGQVVGRLAEQVPYLEWRHSAFPGEQQTCQSCHMPAVREDTAISAVLGVPRPGVARHVFRGGNFFMLGMLNRFREELGVKALPQELNAATRWTVEQLRSETATVTVDRAAVAGGRVEADVAVRNLAGHKLPTGYPSRRVWLHVRVTDGGGRAVFESGALSPAGAIAGNDSDEDPRRFEPHHTEIREAGEVQVYESVMADHTGAVTTGLLSGVRYLKDNRLLPRGFDKGTAPPDVASDARAAADHDFEAGVDRVRYSVDVAGARGPFTIDVALRFQPIGYRWAQNLSGYDAAETRRFVSYFNAMAPGSAEALATARATARD